MYVVDASVLVSWSLSQDAHHVESHSWISERVRKRENIVLSGLALAELAGAVSRRTGNRDLGRQAFILVLRLSVVELTQLDRSTTLLAAGLAAQLSLRGSDAIYVALASRLDLPLVTWDEEQAERAGVAVKVRSPRFLE